MRHSLLWLPLLALMSLFATGQTPDQFQFGGLPAEGRANVAFPVRITAADAAGRTLTNINNAFALVAYGRRAPEVVITEVAMDGQTVEFQNPGTTTVDLSGWELEATEDVLYRGLPRVELPPGSLLAPGAIFLWSGRFPATNAWPMLGSTLPLRNGFVLLQLRDPQGRTVDQVQFGYLPDLSQPSPWIGGILPLDGRAGFSLLRGGEGNRFTDADWSVGPSNFGQTNPKLALPWLGARVPVAVTPEQITFTNGIWSGLVTLAEGGAHLNLAVDDGSGRRSESAGFELAPAAALTLTLTSGTNLASEAHPGLTAEVAVTLPTITPTNLVVSLVSAAPQEFSVPATVVIPAGGSAATFGVTNHDDTVADGRARVVITARAEGFSAAETVFFNDDDEAGQWWLKLPDSASEGVGFHGEPGRIFLATPALHDVEVQLSSGDPLLEVPATVVVPAGRQSAEFLLRFSADPLVTARTSEVSVTASIPGWPVATATMSLYDSDPHGGITDWPGDPVQEGHPVTVNLRLYAPHAVDERVTFTSTSPRLPPPADIVIPAGTTNVQFQLTVPDNDTVDPTTNATVCLQLTDGFTDCRQITIRDNDPAPLQTIAGFGMPTAMISGAPWTLYLAASAGNWELQPTNFIGEFSLSNNPPSVTLAADSRHLAFTNGLFYGPVTPEGAALGVLFHLDAAGISLTSGPVDIVPGHLLSQRFHGLAPIPGRGNLLLTLEADSPKPWQLVEVDPLTGNIVRALDLPCPANNLAVSADGSVAWLCSDQDTLQRIDLAAWRFDREVPLGTANYERADSVVVLPGGPDRLIVTVSSTIFSNDGYFVAFVNGQRLPDAVYFLYSSVVAGRTPTEVFVQNYTTVFRMKVGPTGLSDDGVSFPLAIPGSAPAPVLFGNTLLLSGGQVLDADTLAPLMNYQDGYHGGVLGRPLPLPDHDAIGYLNGDSLVRFSLTSHALLGQEAVPNYPYDSVMYHWGERGFAHLSYNGLSLWESPLLSALTADLAVSAMAPAEVTFSGGLGPMGVLHYDWAITVTNRGPDLAHNIVLAFDAGGVPEQTITALAPGDSRTVQVTRLPSGPGIDRARVTVRSEATDPNPSDNSALLETAVTDPVVGPVKALTLDMTHLIASPTGDQLYAAVASMPGGREGGVAVINPFTATVERVLPVGADPRQLAVTPDGLKLLARLGTNRLVRWNFALDRLDLDQTFTNEALLDFIVLPGGPGTLALATGQRLAIYDSTLLLAQTDVPVASQRCLGMAGEKLWLSSPGELRGYQITASGLTLETTVPLTPDSGPDRFASDNRRLYFDQSVYDLATQELRAGPAGENFLSEPARDAVYTTFGSLIRRYDRDALTLQAEEPLAAWWAYSALTNLVRWGGDGLALRADGQSLILFHAAAVPNGTADLAVQVAMPPFVPIASPFLNTNVAYPFASTVTVTNRSDTAAAQIRLSLAEDGGFGNLAGFAVTNATFLARNGALLIFELADLPPHGSTVVGLNGTAVYANLHVRAEVVAGVQDPDLTNNVAEGTTIAEPYGTGFGTAALLAPARVDQGAPFEVTLVVTNAGPFTVSDPMVFLSTQLGLQLLATDHGRLVEAPTNFPGQSIVDLGPVASQGSLFLHLHLQANEPGLVPLNLLPSARMDPPVPFYAGSTNLLRVTPTNSAPGLAKEFLLPSLNVKWSESRQQIVASYAYELLVLAKDAQELIRQLPVPNFTGAFALTDDGRYAWVASYPDQIARLDLDTGAMDFRFTVAPEQLPPAGAMAAYPGSDEVVIIASSSGSIIASVRAVDRGIPRDQGYNFLPWGSQVSLLGTPDGFILVSGGQSLSVLQLDANGLSVRRNLDGAVGFSSGEPMSLAEGNVFFGNGLVTELAAGTGGYYFTQNGPVVADPVTGLAYQAVLGFFSGTGQATPLLAFDARTLALVWREEGVVEAGSWSPPVVPLGTNGVLILGNHARLVFPPDPATRTSDLAVTIDPLLPVLGTNQLVYLNIAVTNRTLWGAADARLRLEFSAGLELATPPPTSDPVELPLPMIYPGTNVTLTFRTTQAGPQFIRARVSDTMADVNPADNVAEVTFITPPAPFVLIADTTLGEGGSSDGLVTAILTSPAAADFQVVYRVESVPARADGMTNEPVVFLFHYGDTVSQIRFSPADGQPGPDRTVRLVFQSGPVVPLTTSALVTILDRDTPMLLADTPALSVPEGDAGQTLVRVPVVLAQAAGYPVEVSFAVGSGTATAGEDFLPLSGRLHFEPGQQTNFITVPVLGDRKFEPAETVLVTFTEPSPALAGSLVKTLTIRNDDPPPPSELRFQLGAQGQNLVLTTVPGASYSVDYRTNLLTGAWQPLISLGIGDGNPLSVPLTGQTNGAAFYRVRADMPSP